MEIENKKILKRLTINLPAKWHTDLKMIALKYNITLTVLITRMVVEKIRHEKELDNQ